MMPKRIHCFSLLATLLLALTSLSFDNSPFTGKVVGISDGDTIKVMREELGSIG